MIVKFYLLSSEEIVQTFRYLDFQVYPLQNEKLQCPKRIGEHPNILEVKVEKNQTAFWKGVELSENFVLGQHALKRANEIALLLTGVSAYVFHLQSLVEESWFNESDEILSPKVDSKWGHKGFVDTSIEIMQDDFTDLQKIKVVRRFEGVGINDEFCLEKMKGLIDKYHKLQGESQKYFSSALYLYKTGCYLFPKSKSLSMSSFISSIETLVDFENRNVQIERCDTCGQEQYKVVRKFKDFVLKYGEVKAENPNKVIGEMYSKRSKLLHKGEILAWDKVNLPWIHSDSSNSAEFVYRLKFIAQRCLINWLKQLPVS